MRINCFRAKSDLPVQALEAPRPVKARLRRTATSLSAAPSRTSTTRTTSNASISSLPPCKRMSEAAEALLMSVPPEPRPSRCLRLSHPKTYSDIVESMKKQRGCRDWRTFDVFDELEVDLTISANDKAKQKAADYEKRLQRFGRTPSNREIELDVDMIG